MQWDHNLVRRFSSTSHFRLLSQVRSELRAQPLSRDTNTKILNLESRPSQGINLREEKKYQYNYSSRNHESFDQSVEQNNRTFKDRLNSIDMR